MAGLLPILAIGAPFLLVAWLSRGLHRAMRRWTPPELEWREIICFDPRLGWRNRPLLRGFADAGGAFSFTTDRDGWRGRLGVDEAEVVVFGDSYAFGYGADERSFFAHRAAPVKVKALGACGYSMVQGLLLMESVKERLRGKLVVWLVCYGNDLYDNLQPHLEGYRAPFVRVTERGCEIVGRHVCPEPWPMSGPGGYAERLAEICSPTPVAGRAWRACGYLVGRAARICREAGAELVVAGIPAKRQVVPGGWEEIRALAPDPERCDAALPDRTLAGLCEEAGVEFVPLRAMLAAQDFRKRDSHWSPKGDEKVARLLATLAMRRGAHAGERAGGDSRRRGAVRVRPAPGLRASAGR